MSQILNAAIAVIGVNIGKNSFRIVSHDERGAIVLRQRWSRRQVEARFANMPPCLIGMEACVGAHHLSRKLRASARALGRHRGNRRLRMPRKNADKRFGDFGLTPPSARAEPARH